MEAPKLPSRLPLPDWSITWRGGLAFALLAAVGGLGPTLFPSAYIPDIKSYLWSVIALALAVGIGVSAVRSAVRGDRVIGLAVTLVGGLLIALIAIDCISILAR
jgi:hypothetical protein